jgi:hypothetical protein
MGHTFEPGLHPFWFWNSTLDKNEIQFQIHEMAAKGIKGFVIHPRQGMHVPYLSNQYFDFLRYTLDCARTERLQVHLYDEFPYPSGNAGEIGRAHV